MIPADASRRGIRRHRRWLALLLVLACHGCSYFRGAAIPVWHQEYPAADRDRRDLIVMLPGIGDRANDFEQYGFVERVQAVNPHADVVTVEAHVGYYVHGLLAERVHQDVVEPRRDRYRRIFVVGISLGGLGAMSYAGQYPHVVDGVVLIAPFVGGEGVVDEVLASGGVRAWVAPQLDHLDDPMRRLAHTAWTWVRGVAERSDTAPDVYLGYGSEDRFARGHALLAEALPGRRVHVLPGSHDWDVWTPLFDLLASQALGR